MRRVYISPTSFRFGLTKFLILKRWKIKFMTYRYRYRWSWTLISQEFIDKPITLICLHTCRPSRCISLFTKKKMLSLVDFSEISCAFWGIDQSETGIPACFLFFTQTVTRSWMRYRKPRMQWSIDLYIFPLTRAKKRLIRM